MRLPIATISIALVTIAIYFFSGAIPEPLIWHQDENRTVWQWVSAHFVHINLEHLMLNVAAFVILGAIVEQTSRKVLGLAMLSGVIGVNLYLATMFSLDAYAGMSGALNALLLVALYFLYQQSGYRTASIATLTLSLTKIIVEFSFDLSLFSTLPWPSVPQAHLAGMIGGAALVAVLEIRKRTLLNSDLVSFNELLPESRATRK